MLSFTAPAPSFCCSFIFAFIFPSPLFQNPLVSVAPRLFVGIVGYGAYRLAGLAAKGLAATAEKTRVPFSVSVILAALGAGGAAVYIIFARSALNAATAGKDDARYTEVKLALVTAVALIDNAEIDASSSSSSTARVNAASSLRYQTVQLILCRQSLASALSQ